MLWVDLPYLQPGDAGGIVERVKDSSAAEHLDRPCGLQVDSPFLKRSQHALHRTHPQSPP